jgi:hypothetical protein
MDECNRQKVFYIWRLGKDENKPTEKPSGIVLRPEDFEIALEPDEHSGGLSCGLTGEIEMGRFAVRKGLLGIPRVSSNDWMPMAPFAWHSR